MIDNAIWITWENQVRNKSLASMLGVKLYIFTCGGSRLKRYLFCTFKTLNLLFFEKPKIVFAQNPSIVLNLFLLLARPVFHYKLVSDAHFAGVIAFNKSNILQKVLNLCNNSADLVIVTNYEHAQYVEKIGGKPVICEDPLPDISKYWTQEDGKKIVLFICSFDNDEPFENAFKAAEILARDDFEFYVSGNYVKAGINPAEYPYVTFLGYLPERDYYTMLFRSNIILDLTESDNCLVCGAYEAMAAEKPLVTSDSDSLKNYFTKGTVFTKHDPSNIANAVKEAYQNRIALKAQIMTWKDSVHIHQDFRLANIYNVLGIDVTRTNGR